MKITAINGSPHKEGNKTVRGCIACYACANGECALADDDFRSWTSKMYEADAVIIGSPVYYAGMAGTLKSFLDRAFFQSGGKMRNKIGAGIAICRRSGGMTTFEQLNAYFLISQMVVAPSFYWNIGHGFAPGDVLKDLEAMTTLEQLAQSIAWLVKMKEETKDSVLLPENIKRERMNFIR